MRSYGEVPSGSDLYLVAQRNAAPVSRFVSLEITRQAFSPNSDPSYAMRAPQINGRVDQDDLEEARSRVDAVFSEELRAAVRELDRETDF